VQALLTVLFAISMVGAGSTAHAQADNETQADAGSERAAIEIITIQNRDPAFVRTAVGSALDPRGSIAQVDNKLIIATTATNLQQLKELIEQSDLPARRLIVSVDFDHSSPASSALNVVSAAQQSVQAIEGDTVSFSAGDTSAGVPQLMLTAIVQENLADADIVISNVPGFTGLHRIQLTLGEWYIINPTESPEEQVQAQQEAAMPEMTQQTLADPLAPIVIELPADMVAAVNEPSRQAQIAVRVDVLP
jgi:sulfur carrier protein ThiS